MIILCLQKILQKNWKNDDNNPSVSGATVKTGTTFYTQHTWFNIPEESGHAVDESQSESKKKTDSCGLGTSTRIHGRNQS